MKNGKMWRESPLGFGAQQGGESMSLVLHFQLGYGAASPFGAPSPSGGGFYRTGGGFGIPSASSSTMPPQYHFDRLRVLLLDGDDTSREVTRKLLKRLGCQVLPVPSAAHCLGLLLGSDAASAVAADQPPFQLPYLQLQMVVLDLHAPAATGATEDGFEVARRIRELTSDSFSWLLILVPLPLPPRASSIDVRDACQRTGVNGMIPKPITLPALGAQL
jgi:ethylene receptor